MTCSAVIKQVPIRDIEIADLLRRDPVELDTQSIAQLIEGRTIMVTGAGGSIGSEICRQTPEFQSEDAAVGRPRRESNLRDRT